MAKIVKVCPVCGKEFEVYPYQLKNGKGKYCSVECAHKSLEKKEEVICSLCGKTFFKTPYKLKGKSSQCVIQNGKNC